MWNQSKKYKKIAVGIVLALVLILGLSRLKLQSVDSFRREQSQAAQELGLDESGQESGLGSISNGDGQSEESESVETEIPDEDQMSQSSQKKETPSSKKKKEKGTESSGSDQNTGKNSAAQETGKKKKNSNSSQEHYTPLGGTGSSSTGGNSSGNNSGSVGKDTGSQDSAGQNNQNTGQNGSDHTDASNSAGQQNNASANVTSAPSASGDSDSKKEKITCIVQIRCDELVKNKDKVSSSLWKYIPSDGMILTETKVSVEKGATAYDVLRQICKAKSIALDAEYTPLYQSYYVKGIGYLYEKQAGDRSGWIYKINGKAPNRGASSFTLSDGDQMVWSYTCDGINS